MLVGDQVFIVDGATNYSPSALTYSFKKDSWTQMNSMKTARTYPTYWNINDKLVVMGGGDGFNYFSSTEVLNLSTMNWSSGQELPYTMAYGNAVQYEGDLYLIVRGGLGDGAVLKWNLLDDSWTEFAKTESTGFRVVSPAPVFNQTIE